VPFSIWLFLGIDGSYYTITVGLATRLAIGLMTGGIVGAVGVADLTRALRPVLIVLVF